jgi:hypothetical protein
VVPLRLVVRAGPRVGATAAALTLALACGRGGRPSDAADPATAAAERVRAHYATGAAAATGAWTWIASDTAIFVFVDVQSTVPGEVEARADLWLVADTATLEVGRSDPMPAAAEIGAYGVEDLTGDGVPDLFGYVADSAGVRYPIFLTGRRGAMSDELTDAAPGWRFATEEPQLPAVVPGPRGPCALQLWAEDPPPDGRPAGWRYLALVPGGHLGPPTAETPACP